MQQLVFLTTGRIEATNLGPSSWSYLDFRIIQMSSGAALARLPEGPDQLTLNSSTGPPPADGDRAHSPAGEVETQGPRRAERRRRKPMAISGSALRDGPSRVQVAVRMQQSANPCAQGIKPWALQTSEAGSSASESLR